MGGVVGVESRQRVPAMALPENSMVQVMTQSKGSRIVNMTSPRCSPPAPCPRDRHDRANTRIGDRDRSPQAVAHLPSDLRALQNGDCSRASAPWRPRARTAQPLRAVEHGTGHGRAGLYDPCRRGIPADARRGGHVRFSFASAVHRAFDIRNGPPASARSPRHGSWRLDEVARCVSRSTDVASGGDHRCDER